MITVERISEDSVRLSTNDHQYLSVSLEGAVWKVRRCERASSMAGEEVGDHPTAEGAVAWAKAYLERGKDELDRALESHGL